MAGVPQSGADADTVGAEAAVCTPLGTFDHTVTPVKDVALSNTEVEDNIVQRIDMTKVAVDEPDDHDYDDPYPPMISDKAFDPVVPES